MSVEKIQCNESRILFHLLAPRADKAAFKDHLETGIDWNALIKLAEDHKVVPLVFKRLKADYSQLIEKEILDQFLARYQQIAKFNFARTSQLIELVDCLQEVGIPVIAYKGMALAKCSYKDVSLRQFGDIDLLIRKADFLRVKELFEEKGCKPVWDLNSKQEDAVLRYYYEYPFFYGDIYTLVEVHWDFLESFFAFDIDLEEVWGRAQKIDLYGKQMNTLSSEDYLVVLCAHGSKHFWKRLSWICDIAKLVENSKIDWTLVKRIAVATGSLRMMCLGLQLTQRILYVEIPREAAELIEADHEVNFLARKIEDFLRGVEDEPTEWKDAARLHLKMREDLKTKVQFSHRLITAKLIDKLLMPMGRPR